MEKYANNSNKASRQKEDENETAVAKTEHKLDKVVTGNVRTKKKSKIMDSFISEDVTNVKKYIIGDILIPTFKKTISEMVSNGVDMMLYGEVRKRKDKRSGSRAGYVSYRDHYDDRRDSYRDDRRERSYRDFEDIILDSRGDAEDVLDRMEDVIDKYGAVSITDLYDLVGYSGGKYTDSKYGWTNLRSAGVQRTRDGGYLLDLPPVKVIE